MGRPGSNKAPLTSVRAAPAPPTPGAWLLHSGAVPSSARVGAARRSSSTTSRCGTATRWPSTGSASTVERGTITAVLGPNGAGKTTTLETCEGYRRPQRGTVRVLGLDPQAQRRDLLPRIGVMLQSGGAWSGVRAVEMLRHIARLHAHPLDVADAGRAARASASAAARRTGGSPAASSSGSALAMAVVGRPELVFVDEPTAGMDPQARRTTWELLQRAARRRRDHRAHHALHGRGRAARRPGPRHRPRPADRLRHAARADPRRRQQHDPAGGDRAVPAGAPASLQAALGAGTEVHAVNEHSLLITGPADATHAGQGVRAGATSNGVLPGVADPRRSARSRTSSCRSPDGSWRVMSAPSAPAPSPRRPAPRRCPGRCSPRPGWRPGCCSATASSCCWPSSSR